MKKCSVCLTTKPSDDDFYRQPKNKDGLQGACKSCHNRRNKRNAYLRGRRKYGPGVKDEIRKAKLDQGVLDTFGTKHFCYEDILVARTYSKPEAV